MRQKYAEENGILPEENGRIPPILTNPTLNKPPHPDQGAARVLGLAQKASFAQGRGTDPKSVTEWNVLFINLQKAGVPLEAIDAEIDRSERDTSEKPWQFKVRMLEGRSTNGSVDTKQPCATCSP